MIKRYKRANSGYMRRSSRIYLKCLNRGKRETLRRFLLFYANVVNYFIETFWSSKDFSKNLPGRKKFHYYVGTEVDRIVKQVNFDNVKTVAVEDLRNVKKSKRGKFSRHANRLLSFWLYARVQQRLRQVCEEKGIRLEFKSPWKTSQACPRCHKIDRRNRNVDKFRCVNCAFEQDANMVGAVNLRTLGLAGAYSLGSLQRRFCG